MSPAGHAPVVASGKSTYITAVDSSTKVGNFVAVCAHSVGDAAEKSYRRGAMLEKRRKLMEQWARYCTSPPVAKPEGKVVSMRGQS